MIATADEIKSLGFDSDVLNISDEIPDGQTKSPLTLYIERTIRRAAARIARLVTETRYDEVAAFSESDVTREAYQQAEILLTIADLLPVIYAQVLLSEEMIKIEGVIKLRRESLSGTEQAFQIQQLVDQAESYLIDDIVGEA